MSEKIEFEVQRESKSSRHGWRAVGGREGYMHVDEDTRIYTRTKTVEQARKAIVELTQDYKDNWLKVPAMRIVKITVVTTYDVVE